MTMMDKITGATRMATQMMFDKESISYLEAGALYGIVAQGRFNLAVLETLYNQAQDVELRKLVKQCIEEQTRVTI